jgi:ATP-binding cassette subfamily C protein LapB
MTQSVEQLEWAIKRLAQSQGQGLDGLRFKASLKAINPQLEPGPLLASLCSRMGFQAPRRLKNPDPAQLPLLAYVAVHGWVVLVSQTPQAQWQVVNAQGSMVLDGDAFDQCCASVDLTATQAPFGASVFWAKSVNPLGFTSHLLHAIRHHRRDIMEGAMATLFIGFLALATSLFSMQVYDRVIPTRSEHTLIILSSGVLLTILVELAMKFARSKLMDHVVIGVDRRLSREIFTRLLSLRVDQLPASVGSLAGQVRGYEQVRKFFTSSTLFTLVDLPLALVFVVLIALIGHPVVALVPLVAGLLSLYLGLTIREKMGQQAQDGAEFSNQKTGLLVETVEGVETIKAGSGGWKFLSRWIRINQQTIQNDLKTRTLSDSVNYYAATLQQISYAGIVVAGAWATMNGLMTMGAVIACSILGGRVLAPVITLPGLLVQHAHARAAIEGLERLYQLKVDNQDVQRPLTPNTIEGRFDLQEVVFAYGNNPPSLAVRRLQIEPGQKIAVVGPIGSGKSTLLRLLTGMYLPTAGKVLLDGLDLASIHRQVVSENVGYLQQDHRLFQGTVRENLLVGLPDPGDQAILDAMKRTGMDRFVAAHPLGLERMISEGGQGLSGGQKQLLAFTRIVLTDPTVMLLDEPTASMDDEQERRCLGVLAEEAAKGKTIVVVTHKPNILPLVDRVIVVVGAQVVMDGPRDAVLRKSNENKQVANSEPSAPSMLEQT